MGLFKQLRDCFRVEGFLDCRSPINLLQLELKFFKVLVVADRRTSAKDAEVVIEDIKQTEMTCRNSKKLLNDQSSMNRPQCYTDRDYCLEL